MNLDRRSFFKQAGFAVATGLAGASATGAAPNVVSAPPSRPTNARPNILIIVADDMGADTPACFGGKTPDISPNIDKLASQGMRFEHGFATVSVCQPSRSVWVTGRYPLHNGSMGFNPAIEGIPMLGSELRKSGYYTALMGKAGHYRPVSDQQWDMIKYNFANRGRDPEVYRQEMRSFLAQASNSDQPFFCIMDIMDPHQPYPGSPREKSMYGEDVPPAPSRTYAPDEVDIPGYLPDTPLVRQELAWYYDACKRCDDIVGALLSELAESAVQDNTVVMFLSDNGAPLPFAKGSCYLQSNRTPWIIRWPNVVKPGSVDNDHFINGIDFMPTVLDIARAPQPPHMDGKSFLSVIEGHKQPERDHVVTVFHRDQYRVFETRAMHTKEFGYIFNLWAISPWVGCQVDFLSNNEPHIIAEYAGDDLEIAKRVDFYYHRAPEELYDYDKDPHALNNLVDDPAYANELETMRKRMIDWMRDTGDSNFHALTFYVENVAARN